MIYGSSRLGSYNGKTDQGKRTLGNKKYELSNHLGNVLAVVSDNKIGIGSNGVADYYEPLVISESDYYPFGMAMKERSFSNDEYRFGFNGMEEDEDLGEGNYNTEFRINNSQLGRWFSIDPLTAKFPSNSPYIVSSNNVISKMDPFGDADFYSQKGEYLGNDGKGGDGRVIVVTDRKIAKQILKNKATIADIKPEVQYELPPYEHRQEIKAIVEGITSNDYEVGGQGYFLNEHDATKDVGLQKSVHVRAEDGEKHKDGDESAHIHLSEPYNELSNEFLDKIEDDNLRRRVAYRWHLHPTKTKTVPTMNGIVQTGTQDVYVLGAEPSYVDIDNAGEVHNNFVVFDNTIYFYNKNTKKTNSNGQEDDNGTGSDGSIKSKLFFNLKEGDANSREGK